MQRAAESAGGVTGSGHQRVAAMTAERAHGAQTAIPRPYDHDGVPADLAVEVISGTGELVDMAQAGPVARNDVIALEGEEGGIGVAGCRQGGCATVVSDGKTPYLVDQGPRPRHRTLGNVHIRSSFER